LKIRVISSKKTKGTLRGKKKQKWKKEIWHRKRAGQTFWRII